MCTTNILDNIVSYTLFEDQTGNLRLVCSQFEASAMKLLEHKLLDQVNEIGRYKAEYRTGHGLGTSPPYKEDTDDWFKARIQRGWSNIHLTSKESSIEDVLWLSKCCCIFDYCKDEQSCPFKNERVRVDGGDCGRTSFYLDKPCKKFAH